MQPNYNRLLELTRFFNVSYLKKKIHRRYKLCHGVDANSFDADMVKLLEHHTNLNGVFSVNYSITWEFTIAVLEVHSVDNNVFDFSIEFVLGIRDAQIPLNVKMSQIGDPEYEYSDVELPYSGESSPEFYFHKTEVSIITENSFYDWYTCDRANRTYSLFTAHPWSRYCEIWRWPTPIHQHYTKVVASGLMSNPASSSFRLSNVDLVLDNWRLYLYLMRLEIKDGVLLGVETSKPLSFLWEEYSQILEYLQKRVNVSHSSCTGLESARILVEKYPNVLLNVENVIYKYFEVNSKKP